MQILAQINDIINRTYTIDVSKNDTIEDIKHKIQAQSLICHKRQTLTYNGKKLQKNTKLIDYNIPNLSVINVVLLPINISNQVTIKDIKLTIDLSQILPFGNCTAIHSIECDYGLTIKSILNDMELSYISHMLQLIFYYGDKNKNEISFKYQQIENKTTFDIKKIIHTQYVPKQYKNELYMKLFLNNKISSFSLPKKIIIQSQFISKFSEYVSEKNSNDEYNSLELNIIMQLVSTMCTLKSTHTLLYEIAECVAKCFQYGIPHKIDSTFSKSIIPTIVTVLSYSKCDKVTVALSQCLLNIKTYDKILNELDIFCDPCSQINCLHNISKFYCELTKSAHDSSNFPKRVFEQLYTLIFYEDDVNVLINILISYHKYICLYSDISDNIVNNKLLVSTKNKYKRKREQNTLLFAGFIRKSLIQIHMKYIPNDLLMLIFSYYNCYYDENIQTNMIKRVIDLFNKNNNGYCKEISEKAFLIAKNVIEPLASIDVNITGSMLIDTFWDYGFVNGLIVLMKHFRNDYDDHDYNVSEECKQCGTESILGSYNGAGDTFYCMDCWGKFTLIDILDLMDFLVENNWTKNLWLKQIECSNENKFWKKTKQYAKLWKDKYNYNNSD